MENRISIVNKKTYETAPVQTGGFMLEQPVKGYPGRGAVREYDEKVLGGLLLRAVPPCVLDPAACGPGVSRRAARPVDCTRMTGRGSDWSQWRGTSDGGATGIGGWSPSFSSGGGAISSRRAALEARRPGAGSLVPHACDRDAYNRLAQWRGPDVARAANGAYNAGKRSGSLHAGKPTRPPLNGSPLF